VQRYNNFCHCTKSLPRFLYDTAKRIFCFKLFGINRKISLQSSHDKCNGIGT